MRIFSSETIISPPERFTDPFRYAPHPLVKEAAGLIIQEIENDPELNEAFMEGKMLGVLVVSDNDGRIGYLAGFSGNVGGRSHIDGFVPPIFDLLNPSGHFKAREGEITAINSEIDELQASAHHKSLIDRLSCFEESRDEEISLMKARMDLSRKQREEVRRHTDDPALLSELVRESQFEKAQLKRLKTGWEVKICDIRKELFEIQNRIKELKSRRASMSDELQKWIFSQYIVHNHDGEESPLRHLCRSRADSPGRHGRMRRPETA